MLEFAIALGQFFADLFMRWIELFYSPVVHTQMLWIILPIYLSWIFTEFYQEKRGTSFGNAISNGIVVLWVGVDWSRTIFNSHEHSLPAFIKMCLAFFVFCYGFVIVYHGIQTRKYIHIFGKIRNVTYVMLVFTPVVYSAISISWQLVFAIVLFFPAFFYFVEFVDYITPDPKAVQIDEKDIKEDKYPSAHPLPAHPFQQSPNVAPNNRYPSPYGAGPVMGNRPYLPPFSQNPPGKAF
jgi:hypothetical protein